MNRAVATLFVLLLPSGTAAGVYHTGQVAMGTVLQVTVEASTVEGARTLAQAAVAAARHWDDVLTTWRAEGELARLNEHAGRGPTSVSEDLARGLARMRDLHDETAGAFDPAVGPLVAFWRAPRATALPPRTRPIADVLTLYPGEAILARDAALDAGAIGKGIALDAAADLLRREGVKAAFLDFGGSSQIAIGSGPDGWRVLVAGLHEGVAHGILRLEDRALATSRVAASPAEAGAVLDPRSGEIVTEPRLATVLAGDAARADAWSTALVVLGREGLVGARSAGVEALLEDELGVAMTPGFPILEKDFPGRAGKIVENEFQDQL